MEIDPALWLLIPAAVVGFIVWLVGRKSQPVFDVERREFRQGHAPPIPFKDIDEVGIFRYRGEVPERWWDDGPRLAGGYEFKYQVYIRVGDQRVYFDEWRSEEKAERRADEIKATIAED